MVNNHIKLAIIDYGSGNLHSIFKAAKQAASDFSVNDNTNNVTNIDVEITNDAAMISESTHIILPGVGEFNNCMKAIEAVDKLLPTLMDNIINKY